MKITLLSEDSIRLEGTDAPMTIEAPSIEQSYSPFHMLASSLAYCTWSVLYSWGSHAGLAPDGLTIDVSWTFSDHPHRVGDMTVRFQWPGLPESRRAAALRAAELCAVHATLTHPPTINIEQAAA